MEILLSIAISFLTELIKFVSEKLGVELTKKLTAGILLMMCGLGAYVYQSGIVTQEMVQNFLQLALMAAGWYELIYKRVLMVAWNKVFGS